MVRSRLDVMLGLREFCRSQPSLGDAHRANRVNRPFYNFRGWHCHSDIKARQCTSECLGHGMNTLKATGRDVRCEALLGHQARVVPPTRPMVGQFARKRATCTKQWSFRGPVGASERQSSLNEQGMWFTVHHANKTGFRRHQQSISTNVPGGMPGTTTDRSRRKDRQKIMEIFEILKTARNDTTYATR